MIHEMTHKKENGSPITIGVLRFPIENSGKINRKSGTINEKQ